MNANVVHGFEHESMEAKLEWFLSLSVAERLHVLDEYYRLAVALNPKLREGSDAVSASTSVRIVERAKG